MGQNSKIEWTHHTANLWIGCTEIHEGCDNCYARVLNHRWKHNNWGDRVPRRAVKKAIPEILRLQKLAAATGETHRVFVGSMMDIFEKPMPLAQPITIIEESKTATFGTGPFTNTGELRQYFFQVIVPQCPNLMFLLLTKRPGNINRFIPEDWKQAPPANVMFGTSPVNQQTADKLIPQLLEVKGRRFLSCEPLLGPIDIKKYLWTGNGNSYCGECGEGGLYMLKACDNECAFKPICSVIVGGESGGKKRAFDPQWARDVMYDCRFSKVPFFMKQIDKVQPIPEDLMVRELPLL